LVLILSAAGTTCLHYSLVLGPPGSISPGARASRFQHFPELDFLVPLLSGARTSWFHYSLVPELPGSNTLRHRNILAILLIGVGLPGSNTPCRWIFLVPMVPGPETSRFQHSLVLELLDFIASWCWNFPILLFPGAGTSDSIAPWYWNFLIPLFPCTGTSLF
jgi:hypothetical protein